jgi:siroheme synthase-like protein
LPVDATVYPVALILKDRHCLVVGGGRVAEHKIKGLLTSQAQVHVVAREVLPPVRALAGTAGIASIEERPYERGEVAGYRLVVAATGDPQTNKSIYEDAEGAGVWVNSADDPASCSFILPAVARQGPLAVAISTSGYSPALASWLKAHVVEHLGPEVAELAEILADLRSQLKQEGKSTEEVDWRRGLDWDMLDLIRTGRRAEAKERLEACLLP